MNHALIHFLRTTHPDVTVIMASKYIDAAGLESYIDAGIRHFGENRVDAFLTKKASVKRPVTWHFIGTLQSKKVKKVINEIDVLHTVDRLKLIQEIKKHRTTVLPVFLQFNISQEATKHGFDDTAIPMIVAALNDAPMVHPIGVMGLASDTDDSTVIKTQMQSLLALKERLKTLIPSIEYVSMGMSHDYTIALDLGTTHLRLGRILLEERDANS